MTRFGKRFSGTLLGLAGLTLLMLHFSCDESGPIRPKPPEAIYRLEGILAKNLGTDFVHIRMTLARNDSTVSGAGIWFGGDSLAYSQDSTYYRVVLPAGDYPFGTYGLEIRDSSLFWDTLLIGTPDTFSIVNVFPDTRIKSTRTVRVEWSGSTAAEGYLIATAKRDSVYEGTGFSQYVTSQVTSQAFPDSAFFGVNNVTDTGWYYLFVYAYIGSPDSALSADILPVPLPSQLDDNLSFSDLAGRFGAIVVAAFDSMHVNLQ